MNKCLITKLDAYVSNDNIKVYNELIIQVHNTYTTYNSWIRLDPYKPVTLTIDGGTFKKNDFEDLTKITVSGVYGVMYKANQSNSNCTIHIESKYNISCFNITASPEATIKPIKSSDLCFIEWNGSIWGEYHDSNSIMKNIIDFDTEESTKIIINEGFNKLSLDNTQESELDIEWLSYNKDLTILSVRNNNVYGDISKLGSCTKLNQLNFFKSRCFGDYNDLINKQIEHGRTEGSIIIDFNQTDSSDLKFCGLRPYTVGGGNGTLQWTTDTKILYSGYNVSPDDETVKTIYCQGYSQEQVDRWIAAGKTVYAC